MKFDQLSSIISSQMKLKRELQVTERLSSDIGMCSFDMMVLIVEIENACGHEINAQLIKKDMTVKELLNVINLELKECNNGKYYDDWCM